MTGEPRGVSVELARALGQRLGAPVDLVLFDAATVGERATYANPRQTPVGMPWVLINGRAVVEDGEYRRQAAGRVLRRRDVVRRRSFTGR